MCQMVCNKRNLLWVEFTVEPDLYKGGRSAKMYYLSKSANTTVCKYSVTSKKKKKKKNISIIICLKDSLC